MRALWVLKKKYINIMFERYKSRALFDGAEQKKKHLSADVFECFAPTVRHSTHKLMIARACAGHDHDHFDASVHCAPCGKVLGNVLGSMSSVRDASHQ